MKNGNFDPMQEQHMKIVIDTSEIVSRARWGFVLSVISLIISLVAICRTIESGS